MLSIVHLWISHVLKCKKAFQSIPFYQVFSFFFLFCFVYIYTPTQASGWREGEIECVYFVLHFPSLKSFSTSSVVKNRAKKGMEIWCGWMGSLWNRNSVKFSICLIPFEDIVRVLWMRYSFNTIKYWRLFFLKAWARNENFIRGIFYIKFSK